jgi:hypothetical protein
LKIVVIARQEARVKKFSAILRFFTQFGFIVFTYLNMGARLRISSETELITQCHCVSVAWR